MLTASRSLALHGESGPELPRVPALGPLYDLGCRPRHGEVIMIAGRPGAQKSGFCLFWVASMGLPTLYFSADMSPFQASVRLACMASGVTVDEVEADMQLGGEFREQHLEALRKIPTTFSFGSPITWQQVDEELEAHIELWNAYPQVIVFDNLMDFASADSDYTEQMATLANITSLSRATGATVFVLHHASDKTVNSQEPWLPPSRREIKNGLAEKPELVLTVALDPADMSYRVAVVKQRMGRSDPDGRVFATLWADPARTRFYADTPLTRDLKEKGVKVVEFRSRAAERA